MNDRTTEILEETLRSAARTFQYPPTPDIAGAERRRLKPDARYRPKRRAILLWAAALLVLLLAGLLSVPSVRAAVLEFLQIGVVRIFLGAPTKTPDPQPAGLPTVEATSPFLVYDLVSIFDLDGETTLDGARNFSHVPIRLPAYPPGMGEPDRVFLQDMDGSMLVLVWVDSENPEKTRLSLHIIEPGSFTVEKIQPELIQTAQVSGREAIWAVGPYPIHIKNKGLDIRRLVNGYVLIWSEGGITYRLESDLPLEEAVKIAESLK
jgi:hypothetical protein